MNDRNRAWLEGVDIDRGHLDAAVDQLKAAAEPLLQRRETADRPAVRLYITAFRAHYEWLCEKLADDNLVSASFCATALGYLHQHREKGKGVLLNYLERISPQRSYQKALSGHDTREAASDALATVLQDLEGVASRQNPRAAHDGFIEELVSMGKKSLQPYLFAEEPYNLLPARYYMAAGPILGHIFDAWNADSVVGVRRAERAVAKLYRDFNEDTPSGHSLRLKKDERPITERFIIGIDPIAVLFNRFEAFRVETHRRMTAVAAEAEELTQAYGRDV